MKQMVTWTKWLILFWNFSVKPESNCFGTRVIYLVIRGECAILLITLNTSEIIQFLLCNGLGMRTELPLIPMLTL